jgi:polysaccharide export outer membrane protein
MFYWVSMMKHLFLDALKRPLFLILTSSVSLCCVAAPVVDPSLVAYAKSLSPGEQARLASEYGIELPGGGPRNSSAAVGEALSEISEAPVEQARSLQSAAPSSVEVETGLERFGMSVFQGSGMGTPPTDDTLVPEHYLLGPGDALTVTLYGKESSTEELIVDREGQLFVPRLGPMQVAGLSFSEVKRLLQSRVEKQLIGVEVLVAFSGLRKISVFVTGEVSSPGVYNLSSMATMSHAIYAAGGVTSIASLRQIELRRDGTLVQELDLYDLLLKGERSGDQSLRNGDVVFVPVVRDLVSVKGEVLRPAVYETQPDQTVGDLINMAGGLRNGAFAQGIVITRQDKSSGSSKVISVNDPSSTLVLSDGDRVEVKASSDQIINPIRIEGAVVRPGVFDFFEGARVSDFVSNYERDLLFETDTKIGLIVRKLNEEQDIEVIAFAPSDVLVNQKSAGDPELELFDRVILLPLPLDDERGEKRRRLVGDIVNKLKSQVRQGETASVVSLNGAVRIPGSYPLLNNGSLLFLFELAGGLMEGAATSQIEIRRQTKVVDRVETTSIDIDLASHDSKEFLMGNDSVTVKYLQDWASEERVEVAGEVRFPGSYLIRPGDGIAELIERAGGFTENAHIEASRYRSASAREVQKRAFQTYSRSLSRDIAIDDTSESDLAEAILDDNQLIEGRVVIDMLGIVNGDASKDVLLQADDAIYVPRFSETIFVVGEVLEPGAFRFSESLKIQDYIDLAAGETRYARGKDTYLILPSGQIQRLGARKGLFSFSSSDIVLSPGSTIVIPPNLDYTKSLELYSQVSSVVFQSVASIAAFFSIARN